MSTMTSRRVRVVAMAILLSLVGAVAPLSSPPAEASVTVLCRGYDSCARAGYSSHGYKAKRTNLYWRMIGGHNCTNYAAFMLVSRGMENVRPWSGNGDAQAWGDFSPSITDKTPVVGAVAWWDQNVHPAGASGHVAYVEKVISSTTILVSEDNYGGEFYWKRITKSGGSWPSGFIHFKDSRSPAVPSYSAVLESSGVWTDNTRSVALTSTALRPGTTAWVELRYRNTGKKKWSSVKLGTTWPVERESDLSDGWLTPTRVVKHSEKEVKPGAIGTFSFALTVPDEASSGTEWFEHFAPVTSTGTWMLQSDAVVHVAARDLLDFDARPRPEISGEAKEGATLTASTGEWSPVADQYSYQWLRDGVAIDGAHSATRVLTSSDVGRVLTVAVTATKDAFNPSTQTSLATSIVTSMYSDRMYAGDVLASGAQLVSKNGRYQLLQRADGNLMVYDRFSGIPIWASGRTSTGATTTLMTTGNLAVYAVSGNKLWSSATTGTNAVRVVVGNDGHVRLYSASGKQIWSSYTSGR
jgi:surface antigen